MGPMLFNKTFAMVCVQYLSKIFYYTEYLMALVVVTLQNNTQMPLGRPSMNEQK
jgi:hypothetical protein